MFFRINVVEFLFFPTYKLKFEFKKNDCICKESVTGKLGKSLIHEKGLHFQKNLAYTCIHRDTGYFRFQL